MIIQEDEASTVLDKRADALLMVVDQSGRDISGVLKNWLDISQVIEMMAMCKELNEGTLLDFELESAHLYVITNDQIDGSLRRVFQRCIESDVTSINLPNVPNIRSAVWDMNFDGDLTVNLCLK